MHNQTSNPFGSQYDDVHPMQQMLQQPAVIQPVNTPNEVITTTDTDQDMIVEAPVKATGTPKTKTGNKRGVQKKTKKPAEVDANSLIQQINTLNLSDKNLPSIDLRDS